ncbi:hypothetical protein B0A49_05823 [Cryomyces minteri]|uniref:Uncharacterized protein n=1 Tax=Cryomyces minteri TaxID=331657 RepID=A0A4U0WUB3_9PEZI|nr:hypothetical protein B0A49_05823 [Cryomyces minteri]
MKPTVADDDAAILFHDLEDDPMEEFQIYEVDPDGHGSGDDECIGHDGTKHVDTDDGHDAMYVMNCARDTFVGYLGSETGLPFSRDTGSSVPCFVNERPQKGPFAKDVAGQPGNADFNGHAANAYVQVTLRDPLSSTGEIFQEFVTSRASRGESKKTFETPTTRHTYGKLPDTSRNMDEHNQEEWRRDLLLRQVLRQMDRKLKGWFFILCCLSCYVAHEVLDGCFLVLHLEETNDDLVPKCAHPLCPHAGINTTAKCYSLQLQHGENIELPDNCAIVGDLPIASYCLTCVEDLIAGKGLMDSTPASLAPWTPRTSNHSHVSVSGSCGGLSFFEDEASSAPSSNRTHGATHSPPTEEMPCSTEKVFTPPQSVVQAWTPQSNPLSSSPAASSDSHGDWSVGIVPFQHFAYCILPGNTLSSEHRAALAFWKSKSKKQIDWQSHAVEAAELKRKYAQPFSTWSSGTQEGGDNESHGESTQQHRKHRETDQEDITMENDGEDELCEEEQEIVDDLELEAMHVLGQNLSSVLAIVDARIKDAEMYVKQLEECDAALRAASGQRTYYSTQNLYSRDGLLWPRA